MNRLGLVTFQAAVALGASVVLSVAGCEKAAPEPTASPRREASAAPAAPEPADVIIEETQVGTGPVAKDGDKVKLNYSGRLLSTNFLFDSSTGKGKKPFEFTIGKGGAIKGWDIGVAGMQVGGKRKLTIPSRLAYGDKGHPPNIPAKATLVFDVELLSINEIVDAGAGDAGNAADAGKKK